MDERCQASLWSVEGRRRLSLRGELQTLEDREREEQQGEELMDEGNKTGQTKRVTKSPTYQDTPTGFNYMILVLWMPKLRVCPTVLW